MKLCVCLAVTSPPGGYEALVSRAAGRETAAATARGGGQGAEGGGCATDGGPRRATAAGGRRRVRWTEACPVGRVGRGAGATKRSQR